MMTLKVPVLPRKKPKQQRSQALVDAVLTATTRVLRGSRFEKVTTGKIAQIAGVSVGSLYQYFPNKETLVASIIQRELDRLVRRIEKEVFQRKDDQLEKIIESLVELVVRFFVDEKNLNRTLSQPILNLGQVEIVIQARKKVAVLIQRVLEKRMAEIQVNDLESASYLIVSWVMGLVESILFDDTSEEFERRLIDGTRVMILKYLKATPKA